MADSVTDTAALFVVKQSGTVPVISYQPAFVWRCLQCGWLGTGLISERAAQREASEHIWTDHQIAPCRPGHHEDDHRWVEVLGTDAVEVCTRCQWEIGK